MLSNLALGLPNMVACLLLQAMLLVWVIRDYGRHLDQISNPSYRLSLAVISGVMLLLVIGNLAQVAIRALLFLLPGEFAAFDEAFYRSAVNFATLGYGDIVMSPEHQVLGSPKAINGVLMIGVSTAALMSAFQDSLRQTRHARGE